MSGATATGGKASEAEESHGAWSRNREGACTLTDAARETILGRGKARVGHIGTERATIAREDDVRDPNAP